MTKRPRRSSDKGGDSDTPPDETRNEGRGPLRGWKCPKCGKHNGGRRKTCRHCGTPRAAGEPPASGGPPPESHLG